MASKTPRFGFNYFGSGTPGTISDDGQKFTSLDRLTIDRLLSQVEQHNHKYQPPTDALDTAATGVLGTSSDGQLAGGYTYYYRFSVVDQYGNESIASPELQVVTPAPLDPPGAPDLSSDGTVGALTAGYYYYALTAHRDGEETSIGQSSTVSLLEGETSVLLELPEYGDADSFSVWRMASADPGFTRIALVTDPTFTDLGSVPSDPCACDPGVAPPDFNTGISSYQITVTVPAGLDLAAASSWRLYRSVYAGIYNSPSMVHDVVERTDEWDDSSPLVRSWVDTGQDLAVGTPSNIDQNMRFTPLSFDVADTLPSYTGYPQGYPVVVDGTLYVLEGVEWVALSGGGGGSGGGGSGGLSGVLTSPAGLRFSLSVDDTGALVTTATDFPGPPSAPQNVVVI